MSTRKSKAQLLAQRDDIIAQAKRARAEADAKRPRRPPKEKRGAGRPKFEATDTQRQQVAVLAATKTPHETIAMMIGVGTDLLARHFDIELHTGYERVSAGIRTALSRKALLGDIPAIRLWGALYGGEEFKVALAEERRGMASPGLQPGEAVVIILPSNGREILNPDSGKTIDGEADAEIDIGAGIVIPKSGRDGG